MMKTFNKPLHPSMDHQAMDRLIGKLAAAYQSKTADTGLPTEKWRQDVMRSVRQIGQIDAKNKNRQPFGYLAWRLAPVALALLILMTVWILRMDDTLEFQIASLVVSDPVQTDIYNPF